MAHQFFILFCDCSLKICRDTILQKNIFLFLSFFLSFFFFFFFFLFFFCFCMVMNCISNVKRVDSLEKIVNT